MNDPVASPQRPTPSTTTLWLLRHAEVEPRYQGVFGGRIDMDLSARGHTQASALAEYLESKAFDALYASPMKRVQQTLRPLLAAGLPQPTVVPELREVDFGDWTGLSFAQVQARYGVSASAWLDQLDCAAMPKAECARTLQARLEPCLRQILARHAGQQVAIACHGGVIRGLLSVLLDWPLRKLGAVEIDYASLTQVLWSEAGAQIQLLNFTPWRDLQPVSPAPASL